MIRHFWIQRTKSNTLTTWHILSYSKTEPQSLLLIPPQSPIILGSTKADLTIQLPLPLTLIFLLYLLFFFPLFFLAVPSERNFFPSWIIPTYFL